MAEHEQWRNLAILWLVGALIFIPLVWPIAIVSVLTAAYAHRQYLRTDSLQSNGDEG